MEAAGGAHGRGRQVHVTARVRPGPARGSVVLVGVVVDAGEADRLLRSADVVAVPTTHDADAPLSRDTEGAVAVIVSGELVDEVVDRACRCADELGRLQRQLSRAAQVERAIGILMARHGVSETKASEMLRRHARSTNRKLADVASAVIAAYGLLASEPASRRMPPPFDGGS
jgi:ANTAR domain